MLPQQLPKCANADVFMRFLFCETSLLFSLPNKLYVFFVVNFNACKDTHNCDPFAAKCLKTIDSYDCVCNPGYVGDGSFGNCRGTFVDKRNRIGSVSSTTEPVPSNYTEMLNETCTILPCFSKSLLHTQTEKDQVYLFILPANFFSSPNKMHTQLWQVNC